MFLLSSSALGCFLINDLVHYSYSKKSKIKHAALFLVKGDYLQMRYLYLNNS